MAVGGSGSLEATHYSGINNSVFASLNSSYDMRHSGWIVAWLGLSLGEADRRGIARSG